MIKITTGSFTAGQLAALLETIPPDTEIVGRPFDVGSPVRYRIVGFIGRDPVELVIERAEEEQGETKVRLGAHRLLRQEVS